MIKLQVIGHLGKDATVNTVNGRNVINFTMAHSEKYKDAQGVQKDRTIWVDCAYWTDRTAIAPYLKKGTQVYAEGNPDVRTYTTSDGKNGATLTMRVSNVQLLGSRTGNEGAEGAGQTAYSQPSSYASAPMAASASVASDAADDLPF